MIRSGQFERLKLSKSQKERFGRLHTLEQLKSMDPVEFEQFCGFLYEKQGYLAHMSALTGDQGIDLLLKRGSEVVVVQCKRYAGTVGQPVIRDLYGTMIHNGASRAALVTTGSVSRQAEEWAADKPMHLVDGHELVNWVRYTRTKGSGLGIVQRISAWLRGNGRRLGPVFALLLVLIVLSAALLYGISLFRDRTTATVNATTEANLAVPTESEIRGTPVPATPLPPTPTLLPTATPGVAVTVSPNLVIPPFTEEGPLTTATELWEDIPAYGSPFITEQGKTWDGTLDVDAVWRLAYDATYLYGLVIVMDDVHSQTEIPRFAYRGDSLEIELDTQADRAAQAQEDDYQYVISPGDFGDLAPGVFRFRGGDSGVMSDFYGTQAEVTAEARADGYAISFRIPWYDVGMRRPAPGTELGIALSVNDNDTPGEPQQELVLSHVATRQWSRPETWGVLMLGE